MSELLRVKQEVEPIIGRLVLGVAAAPNHEDTPIPDLEGEDNGLYVRLCKLAVSLGEVVTDDDKLTSEILTDGAKGLRHRMYAGMTMFVKQGSPLDMTATLAHEHGHRHTKPVRDMTAHIISETTADGTAFVVCDYFGLDISERAFPWIAVRNGGNFTPEVLDGIRVASTDMITRLEAQS